MKGALPQLKLPIYLKTARLTPSNARTIAEIIAATIVERDARFRQYAVSEHRIALGPAMVCTNIRARTVVDQVAKGDLDRDAARVGRWDKATASRIDAKRVEALQHGTKCMDCGLALMVAKMPIRHLPTSVWGMLGREDQLVIREAFGAITVTADA
jgi:hypothetical protein